MLPSAWLFKVVNVGSQSCANVTLTFNTPHNSPAVPHFVTSQGFLHCHPSMQASICQSGFHSPGGRDGETLHVWSCEYPVALKDILYEFNALSLSFISDVILGIPKTMPCFTTTIVDFDAIFPFFCMPSPFPQSNNLSSLVGFPSLWAFFEPSQQDNFLS